MKLSLNQQKQAAQQTNKTFVTHIEIASVTLLFNTKVGKPEPLQKAARPISSMVKVNCSVKLLQYHIALSTQHHKLHCSIPLNKGYALQYCNKKMVPV
jgi:hypothetical protein